MESLTSSSFVTLAAVLIGAIVAFVIIRKVVKLLLSLLIVAVLAAIIVVVCVRLGYISRETAADINPFTSEAVRESVKQVGAWTGKKAHDASEWAGKKAADAARQAVREAVSGQSDADGTAD